MRQIYPDEAALTDAGLADRYRYPGQGAVGSHWLRANMVMSLDGAATVRGRSGGLSGEADRQVFALLRALADVIVVGAGPAGALLAFLLARRNIAVTLLERQVDFEREFRGEVLMPSGLEVLERLKPQA